MPLFHRLPHFASRWPAAQDIPPIPIPSRRLPHARLVQAVAGTFGDIGLAVAGAGSKAASIVFVVLAPVGVFAACNALIVPFLDPTPSPTRQWLVLGGAAVALVASASTLQWVQQALFPDPSSSVRLRSWAD